MYSVWVSVLLGLAVFIWLILLTWWEQSNRNFLSRLFPKGEGDVRKKFEEVLGAIKEFRQETSRLDQGVKKLQLGNLENVSRVELLRYNPYGDTGGDMSFSVALLSKKGDGIVLTSLHSRSGTRVYAKTVTSGKSVKYEFSKEEEEVIRKAL